MENNSRYPLLINPNARSQKGRRAMRFVVARADKFGIYATRSALDAELLARKFAEEEQPLVIAAGGDGTINAVVRGLAGSQTALGLLPTGTMNVFARELGLPFDDLERCLDIIDSHTVREIDLFEANAVPFVQMAGIGFDAQVIEETSWESKKALGPLSYVLSAVKILAGRVPKMQVELDTGEVIQAACVLVGNGSFYGGQLKLFNMADNSDEFLDLLIYEEAGFKEVFDSLTGAAFNDVSMLTKSARYVQARYAKITSDQDVPYEVDGEYLGKMKEIDLKPAARKLKVIAPKERIGSRLEDAIRQLKKIPKKLQGE